MSENTQKHTHKSSHQLSFFGEQLLFGGDEFLAQVIFYGVFEYSLVTSRHFLGGG